MRPPEATQHPQAEEELNLPLFIVTVLLSLAGMGLLVWLIFPQWMWHAQINTTFGRFAVVFLVMHLGTCFVEYFFHRYVLHKPVIPFLSYFYRQHTHHHNLTRIAVRRTPGGRDMMCVENRYPITEPEQKEASFFPWYTFAVFGLLFLPLIALLQWVFPTLPWFAGGYVAFAASLVLYEVFHAIEHWPFEKWAPLVESRRFGWLWRRIYGFHLRHHAAIHSNEAISGFFTLPVADWVFGTAVFPKSLYKDGEEYVAQHFETPRPIFVIRWLDRLTDSYIKGRRARVAQG